MDVDPNIDPMEVFARRSLERDRTEDAEGWESGRGHEGNGFRDNWR
jgi:hypothetical protein